MRRFKFEGDFTFQAKDIDHAFFLLKVYFESLWKGEDGEMPEMMGEIDIKPIEKEKKK